MRPYLNALVAKFNTTGKPLVEMTLTYDVVRRRRGMQLSMSTSASRRSGHRRRVAVRWAAASKMSIAAGSYGLCT
jgi:hypothetical protein